MLVCSVTETVDIASRL